MIESPVFIVGAPRSGTSLLFHILRTSLPFWSLPSEGQHIWDTACHPALRGWASEECHVPDALSESQRRHIVLLYEQQSMPHWFWKRMVDPDRIWEYSPTLTRRLGGGLYLDATRLLFTLNPCRHAIGRRLLDKTASNSLRLELLQAMFPDARFIHMQRHGMPAIESMLKGWLHPRRFVTFLVPEPLHIVGYEGEGWKFMLPAGWREFADRHLTDICAWQWATCHRQILDFTQRIPDRCLAVKMEELVTNPARELRRLAEFLAAPVARFAEFLDGSLPAINATPARGSFPFPEHYDRIAAEIRPFLELMGYE